jgi:osomolarity two-component system sensor histidine kinase SLN1
MLTWCSVVADASAMYSVMQSREGLDNTGVVLLVGSANSYNLFSNATQPANGTFSPNRTALAAAPVNFVFPPTPVPDQQDRHTLHPLNSTGAPFALGTYPAALNAFVDNNTAINNASCLLSTTNEQKQSVAVGYARPQSTMVDWVLLVEQGHDEAWAPVLQLRNILLGCVFGTIGFIVLLIFPVAHFSVLPIRRLKDATEASVQPPGYSPQGSIRSETMHEFDVSGSGDEEARSTSRHSKPKTGFLIRMSNLARGRRQKTKAEHHEDARRRIFKIPGKVQDKKHYITDELTELTATFNEMSDELILQYSKLEERVAERTAELEISKKAAEAANESKTLFIANISHELKTPLNGILGMCAVCMGEDDLPRIKRSLQVVYKSGDLLLHLLNDLLTFSKNQIGQSLSLEEREFGLSDIKSQITTIFDKQVRDGRINFGVRFLSTEESEFGPEGAEKTGTNRLPAYGPAGTGRLKDMRLWGDQHRILQVIINLVSNSLKFTPEGGKVEVRIRCLGEVDKSSQASRNSMNSKHGSGSQRPSRSRHRVGSGSITSDISKVPSSAAPNKPLGTALLINPMDPKAAQTHVQVRERSPTPPPSNAKSLIFEFEVEDTGPGISPALQERVFEPFVQGDLGLSKKYGGTGLGLSICSQLAGLMGGKITLESTVGTGTTFNMRIPLKYVKERASSTASSSLPGSRPPSVTHDEARAAHRLSGDSNTGSAALKNGQPLAFEKDTQPRLVGLSQPFFASQTPTTGIGSEEQFAALDAVAASKSANGKIRVLVAEDNLVNQEVVLR